MSFLRKLFRIEPPTIEVADTHDPELDQIRCDQEARIERDRERLRTKLQKVQSESRLMATAGGALRLMENDRGRR